MSTERFQRAAATSQPGTSRCDSPSRSILQPVLLQPAEPETVAVSRERQTFIETHQLDLQSSALENPAICPVDTYVLVQGGTKISDTLCCLSKNGKRVVVINDGQITAMLDESTPGVHKKVRLTPSKSNAPITAAACDSCMLLAGSANGTIEAWEVSSTNLADVRYKLLPKQAGAITSIALQAVNIIDGIRGYCAVVGMNDGTLKYFMFDTVKGLKGQGEQALAPLVKTHLGELSAEGRIASLTVSQDGTVIYWESRDEPLEEDPFSLKNFKKTFTSASKIWNISSCGIALDGMTGSMGEYREMEKSVQKVLVAGNPKLTKIVTAVGDKLRLFIPHTGAELLQIGKGEITAVGINDEKALVGTGDLVRLYDFATKCESEPFKLDGKTLCTALSNDGNWGVVATGEQVYLCSLIDPKSPLIQPLLSGQRRPLTSVKVNLDCSRILVADAYGRVTLFSFK